MQIEGSPAVQFTERFKPWQRVGLTILACCSTTLLATPLLGHLDLANIVMLFLLTVLLIAVILGRTAAVLAAWPCSTCFSCRRAFRWPSKTSSTW